MRVITDPNEIAGLENAPPMGAPEGAPAQPEGLFSKIWKYPTTPTEKPRTAFEFLSRVVPESAAKTGLGMVRFPVDVAQAIASPERGQKLEEIAKGMLQFMGEPVGLYGWQKFKEKWSTDPVGAALAISPFAKYGIRKAGFKPIVASPTEPVGIMGRIWNWYVSPPKESPFKDVIKVYQGGKQKISHDVRTSYENLLKTVPEKKEREAITNYVEAGGDVGKLSEWAKTSLPEYKEGYERAMKLSPEAMSLAEAHTKRMAELGEMGVKHGLLRDLLENFVTHLYSRGEHQRVVDRLLSRFDNPQNFREFATKPWMLFHRILENFHEAEKLGFKPKTKDIVALDAIYEQSLLEAINARTALKRLSAAVDPETGKPILAAEGKRVGGAVQESDQPVLIKPRARSSELQGYKNIHHPAFRKWKWIGDVTHDEMLRDVLGEGEKAPKTPVFIQGDLLVHPKYYNFLKNMLTRSAVREHPAGRALLRGVLSLKQTLLSFSGFHQVQVGIHAAFHRVAPWNLPELHFTGDQGLLVKAGTMVSDTHARELFSEGVAGGGVVHRIPGIGPFLEKYTSYLFEDYIPRLKMKMAEAALRRNRERYTGKLSEDQIAEITANQANAAFGELNYKLMGRNPTTQDVLRIMFLAPDFLEARARFLGQALKPWGGEQATALLVGALGMYIPARIANSLLDNDPHFEKPFSVVVPFREGKREFTVRSIPGDVLHALEDPRGFAYYRLSSLTRAGAEAFTTRNMYGQKVLAEDQVRDVMRNAIPIPFQTAGLEKIPWIGKWIGKPPGADLPWWESFLRSMGLSSWPYRSMAEREALEALSERMPKSAIKYEEREKRAGKREIIESLRNVGKLPKDFQKSVKEGKVTSENLNKIFKESQMSNLESIFRRLSLEEALHVWQYTTKQEKMSLRPVLLDKINRAFSGNKVTPEIMDQLYSLNI